MYERLSEPFHLNVISLFVALFGGFRRKVEYDLVVRQNHAYALLEAADMARRLNYEAISVFEFGVAAGGGLINLQELGKQVTQATGISVDVYGFDTGTGMPPAKSYKDHPELYQAGDFPMDVEALRSRCGPRTHLIFGAIEDSIEGFLARDFSRAPIAFVSIDVDYYSSTVDALRILKHKPESLLPRVHVYLDDLEDLHHNSFCGEMAAVHEFTAENQLRPIEKHAFLRGYRLFKNARWIDHMYQCHVLDHPVRNNFEITRPEVRLVNPYLSSSTLQS